MENIVMLPYARSSELLLFKGKLRTNVGPNWRSENKILLQVEDKEAQEGDFVLLKGDEPRVVPFSGQEDYQVVVATYPQIKPLPYIEVDLILKFIAEFNKEEKE